MRRLPVNTLADLVAFVDGVLTPGFDVAAAQNLLGTIDRWIGEMAFVTDSNPRLAESAIETVNGAFCGVQSAVRPPLEIPWSDLEAALGKAGEPAQHADDFSGQASFRFVRRSPSGVRGVVSLYADAGKDPARIKFIIVRPERSARPAPG
jgi:hypothetical protein